MTRGRSARRTSRKRCSELSVKAMTWVWEHSPYKDVALLVHLALADFADDQGLCWPSQIRIARYARCSDRHVRRVIKQMLHDGSLLLVSKSNGSANNRYRLVFSQDTQVHWTPGPLDTGDIPTGHPGPPTTGHPGPPNHHITINNHHHAREVDRVPMPEEIKQQLKKYRRPRGH